MLSRSQSSAGERLRRAKSTSSAHMTSSGGYQHSSTSIDPFVIRQNAETAAVEAYQRAKELREPVVPQAYRPVPPKLQRRRSQVTGKTEGSHFEDARLGRRKPTVKRHETRETKPDHSRYLPSETQPSEACDGNIEITRKRSVIPPGSTSGYSLHDPSSATTTNRSARRRSQVAYDDSSPTPPSEARALVRSNAHSLAPVSQPHPTNSPKPSVRETKTDDNILALAQSHCAPTSQSKKLRERKSLIFAPFQKRCATKNSSNNERKYDTLLPPFNYADEDLPPPPPIPPTPPIYVAPEFTVSQERKSRTLSNSLKVRFKNVFRKVANLQAEIPAQHIEATQLHCPLITPLSTPTVQPEEQEDPFIAVNGGDASYLTVQEHCSDPHSRYSSDEQSIAKSRVTSWTNSTTAGTWSSHNGAVNDATVDEAGRLQRSDSKSTLKKATSFFGRPVRNKLRRASKINLVASEESTGLYSALQERIRHVDSDSHATISDTGSQSVRTASALDTLPSRQKADCTISSRNGWPSQTIRSVTPDPTAYRLDIPSPVAEVLSPDVSRPRSRQDDLPVESTPRSHLQRRPATKAPTPSRDQIERRIERSKNRWQSPLDQLSLSASPPSRHALEGNPYEMQSLSRTLQQTFSNDLPHHARISDQQPNAERDDVLSPSVYSRGTNGESPRPDTPGIQNGTIVTITGREVKSYTISPSKLDQPREKHIYASQDWRRWLSDEMNGWDGSSAPQDLPVSQNGVKGSNTSNNAAQYKSADSRASSESPALGALATRAQPRETRPPASSRLSSYMNERYPMMDTGRNSSDQSVDRRSRLSSSAESRPTTSDSNVRPSVMQERKSSGESKTLKSALVRQRVVTKPRSIAQLNNSLSTERADGMCDRAHSATITANTHAPTSQDSINTVSNWRPAPTKRPKSALDLRANYKSGFNSVTKPLEVRRKGYNGEVYNILEDTTICNISAGPYAASPNEADKENVQPHAASEQAALPALSSSEWLSAGSNKKPGDVVAVHPAYRNRSGSRYSPSRSGNGTPTAGLQVANGGGGSPGHRLATSWLDGRKPKEGSPAFV